MAEPKTAPFPIKLLFLDFIGALLFALGIMELNQPGGIWPEALRFPGFVWLCFIAGGLLMLPMVLHMVDKAKAQSQQK